MRALTALATLTTTLGLALMAPAHAAERPNMPSATIDPACTWEWLEGEGIATWAQDCKLKTGHWHLRWEKEMAGFSLWVDDQRSAIVLQRFALPAGAEISALLPELRKRALIADSDECVFQPAAIGAAPRTIAQFEIRPVGERLKAFEATPDDEVPEPPCGDYAWSTHGVRYFQTDLRFPGAVTYLDLGQDGTLFDPATVTLTP